MSAVTAREIPAAGFAVVDVETTGLDAATDRIIEIGCAITDAAGRVEKTWHSLINPGIAIGNSDIHGITDAFVAHAPCFSEVAGFVAHLLNGRIAVMHNAAFDRAFLSAAYLRDNVRLPDQPWSLCTLDYSRKLWPRKRHSLTACISYIGIDNPRHHAAVNDAVATAGLLRHYLTHTPLTLDGLVALDFSRAARPGNPVAGWLAAPPPDPAVPRPLTPAG